MYLIVLEFRNPIIENSTFIQVLRCITSPWHFPYFTSSLTTFRCHFSSDKPDRCRFLSHSASHPRLVDLKMGTTLLDDYGCGMVQRGNEQDKIFQD